MKTMIVLLALLPQEIPTDEQAEQALKTFRETIRDASDNGQIEAARDALTTPHEKVIKTVGKLLTSDSSRVRIGVALALGDVDHPASVDMLVPTVNANRKNPLVITALSEALAKLGWERGAQALNAQLKNVGDEDVRESIIKVIEAIGKIGSPSSVEPLTDLLAKLQNRGRRNPWPNTNRIISSAVAALRAITGGNEKNHTDWRKWWKENKDGLFAEAKATYWKKETHQREEIAYGDRPPAKSVLVGVRLVDPPDPPKKRNKKKKKK